MIQSSKLTKFKLPFDISEVSRWAGRYDVAQKDGYALGDRQIIDVIAPRVANTGFLSREDFLVVCEWKSKRPRKFFVENGSQLVEEATRIALAKPTCEELRLPVLMSLSGVQWPMASVLLHFFGTEGYPIVDFRAFWTLGAPKVPPYSFKTWQEYSQVCRKIAKEAGVSMRTLDKALWQYSSEKQTRVR